MELKEYQQGVLRRVDQYLAALREQRDKLEQAKAAISEKGIELELGDYCETIWKHLQAQGTDYLPLIPGPDGSKHAARWLTRLDGTGQPIPNVCLKVPTGGGKTLLAAASLERLQIDYLKRQTGFVLWVVPSDAIYRQTWKQLANREHPYRQMLERASGGRVKLLEKGDSFTSQDVVQYLCVMLLMLPSAARQSKETLRMFRDSGRFTSFFPEVDDPLANAALLDKVRNLDCNDLADLPVGGASGLLSIKHSLGNVLRLVRPVILIDEGHRAYSDTARDTLCGFNPDFILELSATPNSNGKHQSNILVSVTGRDLKDEEMIKLPINVINIDDKGDWQHTLGQAHQQLEMLQQEAWQFQAKSGRYIRPIMLIRVERTGREQRDSGYVHAEDVREQLTTQLGAKAEEIRLKTADTDELGDEDLLKDTCPVRYIITKDALREGWDCPFAYVLVALSRTTASTALTQMVGRILRQPHARATDHPLLDECYVFTHDQEVRAAVEAIKSGLQDEGMADVSGQVRPGTASGKKAPLTTVVKRRPQFSKPPTIFLPRILHRDASDWRALDYDRDVLAELDWNSLSYRHAADFTPPPEGRKQTQARIFLKDQGGLLADESNAYDLTELPDAGLDKPFLVRQLLDVVPNPWQGIRILDEALATLRNRGFSDSKLFDARLELVQHIRADLRQQVSTQAEYVFREKLKAGTIALRLTSSNDPELNWQLHNTLEMLTGEAELLRKSGRPLERSLFEKLPERDFNELEKNAALYLDENSCVYWWHRLAVKGSFSLQGWQRQNVYPDLLACLQQAEDGTLRMAVLETKGNHLAGNDDTQYKQRLFALLSEYSRHATEIGELSLEYPLQLRFVMLMEGEGKDTWKQQLLAAIPEMATPP